MTFVCNAGPVIALAKIDRLSLLRELASSVLIPETVFHKVLAKPSLDASRIAWGHASRGFAGYSNFASALPAFFLRHAVSSTYGVHRRLSIPPSSLHRAIWMLASKR